MASPPGNYDLRRALNRMNPVARRANLGNIIDTLINAVNVLTAQNDVAVAFDAGAVIFNTTGGTITIAGSVAAGDWFTVTLVNSAVPTLVSPGITLGPVNVVAGDTATTIAAKLVAVLNASLVLSSLGYAATNSAGVVTLKTVGVAGNSTVITATRSAGAVVTVTAVNPSGGTGAVASRLAAAYPLTPLSSIP